MTKQGKNLIAQIQAEIKKHREIGGFWRGYCGLQKLASGDIWESSTRFIYELLQNAEDEKATKFEVYISKNRIKISHNGNPFKESDVRNLCYAISEKDPNESIGYLGVGFRAVFPVTDKPEIYSGDFCFRFSRQECLKEFNDDSLFNFYPYWVEQITETIDPGKTTFILPFRSQEHYIQSMEQLNKLGAHSLLFLRNIKNLEIHDEESSSTRVCNLSIQEEFKPLSNNPNIEVGKALLVEGDIATRFWYFGGHSKYLTKYGMMKIQ